MTDVRFLPAGDKALVVEFGDTIERALSERVLRLATRLKDLRLQGVIETLPTFRSLLVRYDPLQTSGAALEKDIGAHLADKAGAKQETRLWQIPACYDKRCAPDLDEVAKRTKLTTDDVVARHSGTQYLVYVVGFAAGFPYMGDLPPELVLPRRTDPRVRVPAGSIAMATTLTGIYPLESPGGWHLIGAAPIRLFDSGWERPALLRPGDLAKFEPVDFAEYERIRSAVERDDYTVPYTMVAA
ncbi:MAG: 5-oxoprolinase subunit PxpB [Methylobacteriaceae bacterium]|nr:5-oxoprolinase subunit PxpB [Methylobacteriaceae bacterium]